MLMAGIAVLVGRGLPERAAASPVETGKVLDTAQVARAGWDSAVPPTAGWQPVRLPDYWDARWPGHDGVGWYRLQWTQADVSRPAALLFDYWCLAAEVRINGSVVWRDRSLREPVSRSWTMPHYFVVDAPLLHAGINIIDVRVSGITPYQPGLGPITVGTPSAVLPLFQRSRFERHDLQLLDTAIGGVLGVLFLVFWLLRRKDTVYGWYALNVLFGSLYGYNFVASSPWPFTTTDGWQAFNCALYMGSAVAYTLFLLRFCERAWPRFERVLLAATAIVFAVALAFPHVAGPYRNVLILPLIAYQYVATTVFMVHGIRRGQRDQRILAFCLMLPVLASLHDLAVYLGIGTSTVYLGSLASPLTLVGMAFAVAYRFVGAMRRVEGFNAELQTRVSAATMELARTLQAQHALELSHSRAGERLKLVRDLHDGFGGTLVGMIARIENARVDTPQADVVALLKEMRDDLRLVIDTTAQEHADLATLIAALRHRASRLLEAADIDSHWQVEGLDGVQLEPARSLDLLRLLQEALTNVFKHSRARSVDVRIERLEDRLHVQVIDDGTGAAGANVIPLAGGGAGLASMRLRARRLGGTLEVGSRGNGGTAVSMSFPLAA